MLSRETFKFKSQSPGLISFWIQCFELHHYGWGNCVGVLNTSHDHRSIIGTLLLVFGAQAHFVIQPILFVAFQLFVSNQPINVAWTYYFQ